jgi:anti-sigma B factor antagonist
MVSASHSDPLQQRMARPIGASVDRTAGDQGRLEPSKLLRLVTKQVPPEASVSSTLASNDGEVVVLVVGEIDMATAPLFADALARASHDGRGIVVDLAGVSFMDSQGVNALVRAHKRHADLRLRGVRPNVREVLKMTGLEHILSVEP